MAGSRRAESQTRPGETGPRCGTVVTLADDLAGVQAGDGALVPPDRLGFGLIAALDPAGEVRVHWLAANIETWVARGDLRPLDAAARVITIRRRDRSGRLLQVRYRLATLDHHWTVELLPRGVIRAVRPDGCCWTFWLNPVTQEVEPALSPPVGDDEAEAVVAADLATGHPDPDHRRAAGLLQFLRAAVSLSRTLCLPDRPDRDEIAAVPLRQR